MDICFTSDVFERSDARRREINPRASIFLKIRIPRFRDLSCNYASRRYAMECWKMPLNEGNPDITKRPGIPLFSLLS